MSDLSDVEVEITSGRSTTFARTKSPKHNLPKLKASDVSNQGERQGLLAYESGNEDGLSFTVSEAVEQIGFGKFQLRLIAIAGFFAAADSMEMMLLSILSPTVRCLWHLNPVQEAFITTVVFIGMGVGSSYWGWLADNFGRKTAVVMCGLWIFYFGFLSSFSPHYYWIIALRFMVGFGIGGAPQTTTLLSEFLPSNKRAKYILSMSAFWTIGCVFTVGIALAVMPTLGWRWLLIFLAMPLFIFVIICKWLPESCRYYIAAGEKDKALKTLYKMSQMNKKPMPAGYLKDVSQHTPRGRFSDLLRPSYRRTTLILWFIWLNLAFTYYGIVLMSTELFQGEDIEGGKCEAGKGHSKNPHCGCRLLSTKDYTDLMWTTLAEFPGIIFTFLLIERLGRKRTMAVEFFFCAGCYGLLFICSGRTMMTVFIFGIRGFISGCFQAAYVYTPEVYPTSFRALGLGSCSAVARVGAMITPFTAQVLLRRSVDLSISIYAVTSLLCVAASLLLPIETKGREMLDT